jgi:hypothetical protein
MRRRNPIAKAVTRLRPQVVPSRKIYSRKGRKRPSGQCRQLDEAQLLRST